MNRYKKLVANSGIIALGTFGSKLLVYFLMPFYTSYLTPEMYSTADLITQTAKLLIPLLSVGITETVFRFALDKSYDKKEVFSAGVYTLLAGGILLACVIPVLSAINYVDGYVYIIIMYVFAANFHALATQYIRTKDHFKFYAVQGNINTGAVIVCNIFFLAVFNMGVTGYVLSTVVADFVTTVFLVIVEKLYKHISFGSVRGSTVKSMLKYCLPLIPSTICWWVTNVSDRYMITWMIGASVTGLYAAANKIPSLMMVLSGIFINSWKNSAVMENDSEDGSEFFSNVFDAFSAVLVMVSSGIIAFTKVITFIMLDKSYHSGWIYIPVLTFSMIFFNYDIFFGSIYVAKKKSSMSFYTSIVGAITNVALNLWLINTPLGAMGAAIATVASYVIVFVLRLVTVKKIFPFAINYPKLLANFSILLLQMFSIMTAHPFWIPTHILCVTAVILINGVKLLKYARLLFKR
jgi:O-antigen/teichoic acid export membrane protein